MGNSRNTGYLQNAIKVSDTGAITFMSGSTMLATINTSGQMSGSSPVLFAATASFVANAQSASNAVSAQTASFANALTVAGTLTAQTLVVQTITSSVSTITGSTNFGTLAANTHTFTGSVLVSGSIGIGTTPNSTLHVRGDNGTSTAAVVRLRDTNTTARTTRLQFEDYTGNLADGLIDFVIPTAGSATGARISLGVNSAALYIINGGNIGIGTSSPNALTEIRVNSNDYGNNLILANSYPSSGVATSISFSHNTQAADPDIIARISGYIDDRTSGNRYGSLRFYTGNAGTLTERIRVSSTGIATFTVSGNDTRLANFSTTTYGSTRGLRINSYQSSNGGQDCAIEFDSGVGGYGGFKLSNSGTPMLTLTATGAATLTDSLSIGSTSNSTNPANGSIVSAGGLGLGGDIHMHPYNANQSNYGYIKTAATTVNTTTLTIGTTYGFGTGVDAISIYNGSTTFANNITAGGNINANNIKTFSLTLQGSGTPVSTGLPINAGSGGRTYLLLTSQQWDAGNSTSSTITMIRCGYSGDNFTAVVLASSNPVTETWSQSGGILYVAGNTNFQLDITVINNG